VPSSTPSS